MADSEITRIINDTIMEREKMSEYEQQANDFLKKTKTDLKITFLKYGKHFINDDCSRDIYTFEFKRGNRVFKANFGNSLNDSGFKIFSKRGEELKYLWIDELNLKVQGNKKLFTQEVNNKLSLSGLVIKEPIPPTAYDILACLTKYEPEDFKNFCSEFGYSEDNKQAESIYKAVCEEWQNVQKLWSDEEIEQLREIN